MLNLMIKKPFHSCYL